MLGRLKELVRARRLRKADALVAEEKYMRSAELYLKALGGDNFGQEYHATFGLIFTSLMYGNIELVENLLPQAESMVDFLVEQDAYESEAESNEVRAQLHFHWSCVLRHKRDFSAALVEADKAVAMHASYEFRYQRATMLKHVGRLDEAIAEYRALLRERSEAHVHQSLAGYLFLAGKTDEAIAEHRLVSAHDRKSRLDNEAWIAACRGDRKQCLQIIRESFETGSFEYLIDFYNMDVEFDPYRDDPDFPRLDRSVG